MWITRRTDLGAGSEVPPSEGGLEGSGGEGGGTKVNVEGGFTFGRLQGASRGLEGGLQGASRGLEEGLKGASPSEGFKGA